MGTVTGDVRFAIHCLHFFPLAIITLLVEVPGFTSTCSNTCYSTSGAKVFGLPGHSWCLKDPFSLRRWWILVKVRLSGCLLLGKASAYKSAALSALPLALPYTKWISVYSTMLYFSAMFTNPCHNHNSVGIHRTFIHNVHSNQV